jgi:hypothetical protein
MPSILVEDDAHGVLAHLGGEALIGPGDFEQTLTRLLHATCAGLAQEP